MSGTGAVPGLPASVLSDRAAGIAVAAAAADALGAPHEFGPVLPITTQLAMAGGGPFGFGPGEWTDDTQMALALLTPLALGDSRVEAVEQGFLRWYAARPRDVGRQRGSVLSQGSPLPERARDFAARSERAAGNGALMRIGPAALSHPGQPDRIAEYARATTGLTHADPDCLDASVLWALAIDRTLRLAPPSNVSWDFAAAVRVGLDHLPADRRQRWADLIDEAVAVPAAGFDNNGWVVHAFQAALSAVVRTAVPAGPYECLHLRRGIEAAVQAGGDTDTVAAIAGYFLGARWGATAVPLEWRAVLHGERVRGTAVLKASDLDQMARLAHRGGRAGGQGWPGAPHMVPGYLETYTQGPATARLGGVDFGAISGLAPAIEAGADTVISLCRMGTQDVAETVEHHVIGLIDGSTAENPNLAFIFMDTADLIAARLAEGRRVFVHCVQAENRTPAMAAAYLVRHAGLEPDLAIETATRALKHRPRGSLLEGVRAVAASRGDTAGAVAPG
jgi:ADP-ribosyl-[dinitrogen reductase] hydrolase